MHTEPTRRVYLLRRGTYVPPLIDPGAGLPVLQLVTWGPWVPSDGATYRRARKLMRRWGSKPGFDPVQACVMRVPVEPMPMPFQHLGDAVPYLCGSSGWIYVDEVQPPDDQVYQLPVEQAASIKHVTTNPAPAAEWPQQYVPPRVTCKRISGGRWDVLCPRCGAIYTMDEGTLPSVCRWCDLSFSGRAVYVI